MKPVPILKPCPFCGGEPSMIVRNVFGQNSWEAQCLRQSCGAVIFGDSPKDAANRWNSRTPATADQPSTFNLQPSQ